MMLFITDPHDRWDCHGVGVRGALPLPAPKAVAASQCQLSSADRQASMGFLICAFVARAGNPDLMSGVSAGVVLLLWNAALFFNGGGVRRLWGPEIEAEADFAPSYGRDARAELPQVLLLAHSCIAALGAAAYLLHFYLHVAVTRTSDWARGIGERRLGMSRRPPVVVAQVAEADREGHLGPADEAAQFPPSFHGPAPSAP